MLTVFNYDTPVMMLEKGQVEEARAFMQRLYTAEHVEERLLEISSGRDDKVDDSSGDITYSDVLCDARYRTATYVGLFLGIFQQTTGMNIIFLYSNTVFNGLGLSATIVTVMMGVFNFIGSVVGFFLLFYFGRRSLLLVGHVTQAASLLLLGLFIQLQNKVVPIIFVFIIVFAFECSSGPITWLYNAEILEDKAMSIATVIIWLLAVLVSIVTPIAVESLGQSNTGFLFVFVGVITTISVIFIFCCIRETMGKTYQERKQLYAN